MADSGPREGVRGMPPLRTRLLLRLIAIRRIRSIILQNRDFTVRVPLLLRLRAWSHWFSCRDWLLYDLDRNDPTMYLPHHASLDFGSHFPGYRSLNDKLLFSRGLAALGMEYPRPLAFVLRGRIHALADDMREASPPGAWLAEQAARHGGIVLKPVIGLAGSGLLFIENPTAGLMTANGAAVSCGDLDKLVSGLDQYLVSDKIAQAAYAAAIFPHTTNTLRILTLWDYRNSQPFVAAAVHRFGNSRSLPVDNFHAGSGGLCAPVAIASGWMGAAMTLDESGSLRRYRCHPETGSPIEGVVVPDWNKVHDAVLRAAAAFPESPFVGWDIALSGKGAVFIEANVPPSIHIWQVHGGLLRDPRTRVFFETHAMVRPCRRPRDRGEGGRRTESKAEPQTLPGTPAKGATPRGRGAAFPGGIPGSVFNGYPLPLRARLNLRLGSMRRFLALLDADRKDRSRAPLPARLRALRHGFCNRHWALYDLDHHRPEEYVPDFAELDFGVRHANFRAVNDKLLLSRVLASMALPQPQLLAFVQRGRLLVFDQCGQSGSGQGAWLAAAAVRKNGIVLKPVTGTAGPGLIFLQVSSRRLTANGSEVGAQDLDRMLAGLRCGHLAAIDQHAAHPDLVGLCKGPTVRGRRRSPLR
jgi:hypothetical protein